MDKTNIFQYRREGLYVAAVEGNAISLKDGIARYKEKGKYPRLVFSPVVTGETPSFDSSSVKRDAISLEDWASKFKETDWGIVYNRDIIKETPCFDFMTAVYGENYLTLNVIQERSLQSKLKTSFCSSGNGTHTLDFLIDLCEVFELESLTPSERLIRSVISEYIPKKFGQNVVEMVVFQALKLREQAEL